MAQGWNEDFDHRQAKIEILAELLRRHALRQIQFVLAPGGLAAVATLSPRQPLPCIGCPPIGSTPHNRSPAEMRAVR